MNKMQVKIYDKFAYKKPYIYLVYSEFEAKVNEEAELRNGLNLGECEFDYKSWEERLKISRKKLITAINELVEVKAIKQVRRGIKGKCSIYYLLRFDDESLSVEI